MPNLLATSVRQHYAALQRVAGVAAFYVRGNEVCELVLVPGSNRPEQYGQGVEEVVADGADWLALADDLVIEGEVTKPKRGDRIKVDDVEFEVVHRGEADVWRYSGNNRVMLRIFTQEVRAEEE